MQEFKRLAPLDLTVRQSRAGRTISVAVVAAAVAFALWASPPAVHAQGTLPLPAPGTTPAPTTPETPPGAPGAPGDDARARAAAMAAKANIDVTDAWTRATAANATTAHVYLHLVSAKDPDRLIGLEVSNATRVDVREPTDQGAAKGTAAPSLDVPARRNGELCTGRPLSAADRVESAAEGRRKLPADVEVRQRRQPDGRREGPERERQRPAASRRRTTRRHDGRSYRPLASSRSHTRVPPLAAKDARDLRRAALGRCRRPNR